MEHQKFHGKKEKGGGESKGRRGDKKQDKDHQDRRADVEKGKGKGKGKEKADERGG